MKINVDKNDTISLIDDHDSLFLNDERYTDDNNYGLRVYFNDDPEGDDKTLQRSEAEAWLQNIDSSYNIGDYDTFLDTMFTSGKEYTTGASFIKEAEKLISKTQNGPFNSLDKTELNQLKNLKNSSNTDSEIQDRDAELIDGGFWAGTPQEIKRDLMYAPRDVNEIINGQTSLADIQSYARLDDTISALRQELKTQVKNGDLTEEEAFDIYYNKINDLRNSTSNFSQIPARSWTDEKLNDILPYNGQPVVITMLPDGTIRL